MSWVLKGPAQAFDKREWFAGPDVVELALAGDVGAVRYVEPLPLMAGVPQVMMRSQPSPDAEAVSELLFGEGFEIVDVKAGWALGRRQADRYIGWVPDAALLEPVPTSHRITARRAPVFASPSIKAAIRFDLPFGAQLTGASEGNFIALANDAGFVHQRHVAPGPADRFAAAALFMAAPYRWGGRTPDGVDCSGLVQALLAVEGISLSRDSDQQAACGVAVDFAARAPGDLVFFPGHVGMLLGGDQLCHANAHWMAVVVEPLADVVARVGDPSAVRRLAP